MAFSLPSLASNSTYVVAYTHYDFALPRTLVECIKVRIISYTLYTSIVYFLHGMCKCITHWAFSSSMSLPHLPQEGGDSVEARTYVCTLIIVSIYLVGIWSFCSMPELDASTSTCFTNLLTILLSL